MNRLSTEHRAQILRCLVEGSSIRPTVRITGFAKNTILKLLLDAGKACAEYQNKTLRNLAWKRLKIDEIWCFCYAKQKNVPHKYAGMFGYGDVWTFSAICDDTKIVPSWLLGPRDADTAYIFLKDLYTRLRNRVQIATDGHNMYLNTVGDAFGTDVDYAMLIKIYGKAPDSEIRYSPPECIETISRHINDNPDPKHISTSYVERQNLTMRMGMRRFTRLTNAFSKKVENLAHAVALHFMYDNFCRIHRTLRVTPAMEAGITDHLWDIENIVGLIK